MSNKPKSRTLVGKKTEYTFLRMDDGRKVKVPRHRVRVLLKVLGKARREPSKRSLVKNQWDVYPASSE